MICTILRPASDPRQKSGSAPRFHEVVKVFQAADRTEIEAVLATNNLAIANESHTWESGALLQLVHTVTGDRTFTLIIDEASS